MKKIFDEMSYEDKALNLKQCIEGGYAFVDGVNPIDNLITGIENDPDWFDFEVSNFDLLAQIYAKVLSTYVAGDFNETIFEILSEKSVSDTVESFIYSTYKEGLQCDEADIAEMLDDLYQKLTQGFDSRSFRDITFSTKYKNLDNFMQDADFGTCATIEDITYYKVRNSVDNNAYVLYYDDEEELKLL